MLWDMKCHSSGMWRCLASIFSVKWWYWRPVPKPDNSVTLLQNKDPSNFTTATRLGSSALSSDFFIRVRTLDSSTNHCSSVSIVAVEKISSPLPPWSQISLYLHGISLVTFFVCAVTLRNQNLNKFQLRFQLYLFLYNISVTTRNVDSLNFILYTESGSRKHLVNG